MEHAHWLNHCGFEDKSTWCANVFTQDYHLSQLVHFHLLVAVFLGLLLVAHSPVGGHLSDPKSVLKGLLLVAHSPVGGHLSDPKSVLKGLLLVAHSPVGGHLSDPKSVLKELATPFSSFVL
ncbi:hypothetical protein PGTUg99_019382 [Puccinia graminis f. sp. tritici]|uniref:Uncharacterized protein n=1 Tax=Puccinia graminis f. sp. tritici TaxID=56615 RepID=A0A5B0S6U5_PUCGR|nr:hypothetical protein PGTUg99_019382 [Puccinia graminis f. sp. tritici]